MDTTERVWSEVSGSISINAGASDSSATITTTDIKQVPAVIRDITVSCETASAISVKVVDADGDIVTAMSSPYNATAQHDCWSQTCFGVILDDDQIPLTLTISKPAAGLGGVNGNVKVRVSGIYASDQL